MPAGRCAVGRSGALIFGNRKPFVAETTKMKLHDNQKIVYIMILLENNSTAKKV